MAAISTDQGKIAIKRGVTWGTAVSVATGDYLYGTISVSGSKDLFIPRDIGFAGKQTTLTYLRQTLNVTITCDLAYNQTLNTLIGGVMATEAAAVEQTGGQGDYLHAFDLNDSNAGIFYTIAYFRESDAVIELPSVKLTGFSVSMPINDVPVVTFTGVANHAVTTGDATSTVANINALTPKTYQSAVFNGANHYFRVNADGGAGLSNSNDQLILNANFSLQRTLDPLWALRGANTRYSLEPTPLGDIVGRLTFQMYDNTRAAMDMFDLWKNGTTQKAEIYLDGDQIGSGVNRSYKIQFPYLKPTGVFPTAHDLPAKNQRLQHSLEFAMLKRSAAPTGMTGVTDYMRWISVDLRSTSWA